MTINKTNRSQSFDTYIQHKLKDPTYVKDFINTTLTSLEEEKDASPEEVLATLLGCVRDIVQAHGGVNKFAKKIPELHRSTLYGLFSDKETRKNGPEFLTVLKIMKVCGVSIKAA